jgi:hypothetical protein
VQIKVALSTTIALTACLLGVVTRPAIAQEVTYRNQIAPMWKAHCSACHGAQSPERADFLLDQKGYAAKSQGPRMDSYERIIAFVGWPDAGALMRRLDDGSNPLAGGKPGNMYQHLGATEEERATNLKIVKAWVGEGAWFLNRWERRGQVPAVTKEQLDKLKLAY